MVTAKNLIQNSKADLGWDPQDADYSTWRNNVKDYCARHQIVSKTRAGEVKWQKCLDDAPGLDGFKPGLRKRLADGSEFHLKALEALIVDTLKKRSETSKKLALKRALKPQPRADDADAEDDHADVVQGRDPVALWLADPCDATHKNPSGWIWNAQNRKKIAVIYNRSVEGIWDAIKRYVPAGRTVREILGALEDLDPAVTTRPSDWMRLTDDAEVDAFLTITTAKPIRICFVLHRNDGNPNSPLPGNDTYFPADKFAPPDLYDEYAEDTDAIIRDQAGVGQRRMPVTDAGFEERKYRIRQRIYRQQELLIKIKQKHRAKMAEIARRDRVPPVTIYDSDDEEFPYIMHVKRPTANKGALLVKARAVGPVGRRARRLNLHELRY